MQNIPDKGVSGALYYLQAEYTVAGLSGSLLEVNRKRGKVRGLSRFGKAVFGRTPCYTLPAECGLNCSPSSPAHRLK